MENLIMIRNQSARSIRNILRHINEDDFQERTLIEIEGRLMHLKGQSKKFAVKNANLIEQTASDRERIQQWELYDEIESDYLSARAALNERINELKIIQNANNENFENENQEQMRMKKMDPSEVH